jgi:hypothetical protein
LTSTGTFTPTDTPTEIIEAGDTACPSTPRIGCKQSGGTISFRRTPSDARRNWFGFSWRRGTTAMQEFGNPVDGNTSYEICMYGDGQLIGSYPVPGQGDCEGKPCWKKLGPRARQYRFRSTNTEGIARVRLREGQGRASIRAVGRGKKLNLPDLSGVGSTTIQVVKDSASGPECWESQFDAPAQVNNQRRFRDRVK